MSELSSKFDGILTAISAEAPTGTNVHKDYSRQDGRYTPITEIDRYYGKIKAHQEQLEQSLQRGTPRPSAIDDGKQVVNLSTECLTNESKDLWVAAYLLYALCAESGFSGLRVGLTLLTKLITTFGDQLHPQPIDDRSLNRLSQVADLLVRSVELSPLTDRANGSLCYRDKILADFIGNKPESEVENYLANGAVRPNQLHEAMQETEDEFLTKLAENIEACLEEVDAFGNAMASIVPAGTRLPNHTPLKKQLKACLDLIGPFLPQPAAADPVPSGGPTDHAGTSSAQSAAISNRQEALYRLSEIANFFEQTEPHSPISYAIRRAVDWGNRPLSEVLSDLLPEADMQQLRLRAGIPLPGEDYERPIAEPPAQRESSPAPEDNDEEDTSGFVGPGHPDWTP